MLSAPGRFDGSCLLGDHQKLTFFSLMGIEICIWYPVNES